MQMVTDISCAMSVKEACRHLGVSRPTYYRSRRPKEPQASKRRRNRRRITDERRARILSILDSERFQDMPPRQIWATLLDEGRYACHWRTMYRILHDNKEMRERRNQRVHPPYKKPELLACGPNQVWSWDITTLRGPYKGMYFKLYVILDVFSRYVVGWTIARYESAALAKDLIATSWARQGVSRDQLVIHSDRGPAMVSKTYVQLLADLGVERSYSRPYRSNDNPYSEAHFRSMKYHRTYQARFGSLEDARCWARAFFNWYNDTFYHTDIALMHPSTLHYGRTRQVWQARQRVMEEAYACHLERFVRGVPKIPMPPRQVWINKPAVPSEEQPMRQFILKRDQPQTV